MADAAPALVAGRECGACNVCCEAPIIDVPRLKKLPGVLCPNCVRGEGCRIYEDRPPSCREWFCVWRRAGQLNQSWRPDLCGILVTDNLGPPPQGFSHRGMIFELLGADVSRAQWPPLVEEVIRFIATGVPIFLSVPGPPGYDSCRVLLNVNPSMVQAVRSGRRDVIMQLLAAAAEAALRHPKDKVVLSV